jgi:pilus assembly protein Flp/PilA
MLLNKLKGLFVEEEGQGMAEYALILGVLAVGIVVVLVAFGDRIVEAFNDVIASFNSELDQG